MTGAPWPAALGLVSGPVVIVRLTIVGGGGGGADEQPAVPSDSAKPSAASAADTRTEAKLIVCSSPSHGGEDAPEPLGKEEIRPGRGSIPPSAGWSDRSARGRAPGRS